MKRSSKKLAVLVGGFALSWTAAAGIAAADPGLDSAINTTCNYSQAVAALNAISPQAGKQFSAAPAAQAWLRTFLNAPPGQRQQMAQQAENLPGAAQYFGLVEQMAGTCSNY
ncbi:MAG TPA: hemophore-related protein [Mycobacterium sp.]|nr:hemophore-related protein [Mycobacterium sp.]